MGCAMFFVCMSLHPELNAKIDVMIALAPAAAVAQSKTSIRFQAPFVNQLMVHHTIKPTRFSKITLLRDFRIFGFSLSTRLLELEHMNR